MRGRPVLVLAMALLASVLLFSCRESTDEPAESPRPVVRLATTTSTVGSGLLGVLVPEFEARENIDVLILGRGTGAALNLARSGEADVVLVNARQEEERFVLEGYGVNRRDVMYNDFIVLGPVGDPAGLAEASDVVKLMWRLSDGGHTFLSRGDESGTHLREKQLWELAGVVPGGEWYRSSGEGMLATLRRASKEQSYVLSDRSTFAYNEDALRLEVVFYGDRRLFNPYGVIAVNPAKVPGVRFAEAMRFVDFIISERGQEIIGSFGRERFGYSLFEPMAVPRVAVSPPKPERG